MLERVSIGRVVVVIFFALPIAALFSHDSETGRIDWPQATLVGGALTLIGSLAFGKARP
ncbi:MAG: hypothetical protein ACRCXL_03390 [Dermatophilaceae bacterium]